ncbi:hypothetical protein A1O1_06092 [Capronia coronata CBS 617.96]|uniref:HNH domain-containing protein n=1 Tax=Capronia coronata CBS 617.96 TaxID=1182541 RepID=W9YTX2_9EURO|nr:uncharacterized protein A1O1_06092 [Capronia coronata CBS 617.96]EXJ85724.1 hypothetical protein A1O1_06092 [Capronia coronata CBS 617.96]
MIPMNGPEHFNFDAFRDCLFTVIVNKSTPDEARKGSKRSSIRKKPTTSQTSFTDPEPSELADFAEYLAGGIFASLPDELQNLTHRAIQDDTTLSDKWSLPLTLSVLEEVTAYIPGEVNDSLTAYGLVEAPKSDVQSFITPVLSAYIAVVTTPPPKWIETRTTACEICDRDWVPLTYHHLIPKEVHAKVLKRGWHEEHRLNSVAWLCRACHSFVHRMASNEELAREWYTVDLICSREDVQKWAQWVSRVRWKKT